MVPAIQSMCIRDGASLKDALQVIDKNAQGICFVVDDNGRFKGVLTDGDIRRALLSGSQLEMGIGKIVNTKALSLPVTTSTAEIQKRLSDVVRHIPLLDEAGRPVDYACAHRLHRIPVAEPVLGGNELQYVSECIKTGWISSQGSFVGRFEKAVAGYCGAEYALAVSNGTVALHLALDALGIGEGDEVIVPDFTFAASINAILYTRATPVIVDISPETWTIDLEEVKRAITPRTKAIMPVHIYGHPCHMDELMALARAHNLLVVEDAAEALGSFYKGRHVGTFGDAATFSFFGNKVITTGEGGMVIFREKEAFERAKMLRDHGMAPQKRYWHERVGYNYRLTNLQAAVGVAQMEQLETFLGQRAAIAKTYDERLAPLAGLAPQPLQPWAKSCYWLYTVLLNEKSSIPRDALLQKLLMNGVETRPTFYPLHEMPPYRAFAEGRKFPHSLHVSRHGLSLPSSAGMKPEAVAQVAERIRAILESNHYQ